MWTRHAPNMNGTMWVCNHFVPLVTTERQPSISAQSTDHILEEEQDNCTADKRTGSVQELHGELVLGTGAPPTVAQSGMQPQIIEAHKGGTRLILDRYRYIRNRQNDEKV